MDTVLQARWLLRSRLTMSYLIPRFGERIAGVVGGFLLAGLLLTGYSWILVALGVAMLLVSVWLAKRLAMSCQLVRLYRHEADELLVMMTLANVPVDIALRAMIHVSNPDVEVQEFKETIDDLLNIYDPLHYPHRNFIPRELP